VVFDRFDDADEEVLFAIQMTSMCKQFKVLPRPGGLLDQSYYHVILMQAVLRAWAIREDRDRPKPK